MRDAAVLLPLFSLQGKYGIGELGEQAREFVRFLHASGVKYWQVLPLNPVRRGNSPYQAPSAFAGSVLYISIDTLVQDGYISKDDADALAFESARVDYNKSAQAHERALTLAYSNFKPDERYAEFCSSQAHWLDSWALYAALEEVHGEEMSAWPKNLRSANSEQTKEAAVTLRQRVDYHKFCQFIFYGQWHALKEYAQSLDVQIIGDLPIYVSMSSAEVFENPELFLLDESGAPTHIAGCPPDAFSEVGQLWSNPLYNWPVHAQNGFAWWVQRVRHALEMFSVVRVDHFRGFESYWAVPAGDENAMGGEWREGPRMQLFSALMGALGSPLPLIAEDLGDITHAVHALREKAGLPGMAVMQFAFDEGGYSSYLPHCHAENCVVYTGTHDNDTLCGWQTSARAGEVEFAKRYLSASDETLCGEIINAALNSAAKLAVVPLQDFFYLGGEARINTPGTVSDANWTWRMDEELLTQEKAAEIREMLVRTGRCKGE